MGSLTECLKKAQRVAVASVKAYNESYEKRHPDRKKSLLYDE